ncbi:methyltransferase domain-containing protein [Patescibacteria group bacterium]|nr:methyltransferase domain-containing protein [Patescibacteria group bacterium]
MNLPPQVHKAVTRSGKSGFSILGYQTLGIDSDPDMVKLAMSISVQQGSLASFRVDDIMTLKTVHDRFDVIFSNGVMEHFSDSEIISIVNRHLSISDYVIISVPSDFFSDDQKIYGDERFMGIARWRSILSGTTGIIVEEFSFDSDKTAGEKPQFIGFVLSSL